MTWEHRRAKGPVRFRKIADAQAASVLLRRPRRSEPIYAWQPMSDVSPPVTHQSPLRLIRSGARPAHRMGDLCRQVSWLAARTPRPAFPAPRDWGQWHVCTRLAAYSCGGSHGLWALAAHYRVPFSPARVVARTGTGTPHKQSDVRSIVKWQHAGPCSRHCVASRAMPSSNASISAIAAFVSEVPLSGGRR